MDVQQEAERLGWKSRVKIITKNLRKQVSFATPQAERSIRGTLHKMRSLMDQPMKMDNTFVFDEYGDSITRRRFWLSVPSDTAQDFLAEDAISEITSLEQLADIVYLVRFESVELTKLLAHRGFLEKVAKIRDGDGNTLLHWAAAADLPRKILFNLTSGLRRLLEDETITQELSAQTLDTLQSENAHGVKLHEIAYALKDQSLAMELIRAQISVREKNKVGRTFLQDVIHSEEGQSYIKDLKEKVEEQKGSLGLENKKALEDLTITEEDNKQAKVIYNRSALFEDFLSGDRQVFLKRLQEGIAQEPAALSLFFEETPQNCAINRGRFHFGQLDREGHDWLTYILRQGDLSILDSCMIMIERHCRFISEILSQARADLDKEEIAVMLIQGYLHRKNLQGITLLQTVIATRKSFLLKRLLGSGLFQPQTISSQTDPTRKNKMYARNMALLVGHRLSENLFIQVALTDPNSQNANEDEATTTAMKFLEVLFETLSEKQGMLLFQRPYKLGRPPKTQTLSFLEYVRRNPKILPRVKQSFEIFYQGYATLD